VSAAEPGRLAFGIIDETGHFELMTDQDKGAIIAPHKVFVKEADWKTRAESQAAGEARVAALAEATRAANERNRILSRQRAIQKVKGGKMPEAEKVEEPEIPDGPPLPLYAHNREIKTVQVVAGENTINIDLTEQKRVEGEED
jgi:hypothetical protein